MKIKVLSRQVMEDFISSEKHIVISISDPNSEKVKIISKPLDILSLQFHDVDHRIIRVSDCNLCGGTGKSELFPDINGGHCYACTDKMDIKLFTDEDAKNIVDFVKAFKKELDIIVVHCEAGISRSAGVAGALSLIYNGTDKEFFEGYFRPNMLVYRKILNIYHLQHKYKIEKSKPLDKKFLWDD